MSDLPSQAAMQQRKEASAKGWLIERCERGRVPDALIRLGMRMSIRRRLRDEQVRDGEGRSKRFNRLVDELRASPIAVELPAAHAQHDELPAAFFLGHLGERVNHSCGLYRAGGETLDEADNAMFDEYAVRAQLADGQRVLDIGSGWGGLSVWIAERYPGSQVVALTHSRAQRTFIEHEAAQRGVANLTVVTGDLADDRFELATLGESFDRVLSVEAFTRMKNYRLLLKKVSDCMREDAKLFVQVLAHRTLAYHFEVRDERDWISKYFLAGSTMHSESLLLHFQDDLAIDRQWWVSGTHYRRTARHWLANLDAARAQLMPHLAMNYGEEEAPVWFQRWRMLYMAAAELFGRGGGNEWGVAHYRFSRR